MESKEPEAADPLDLQLRAARFDRYRSVSMSLAREDVFQMDQPASSYQTFYGTSENATETIDRDRRTDVRVGAHHKAALEHLRDPLRNEKR